MGGRSSVPPGGKKSGPPPAAPGGELPPSDMMRPAVLQAPRRFEVAERPTPRPRSGEALVRVAATAVCHTDLSIYTGQHPDVRYPVVLGHEATGVVEAVGPDVRIPVGARVVINPIIACGACDCCLRGDENLCRRAGLLGRELDGSLAEQVVLAERYLHPLPPEIGLEAATLIETLATVHHAQRRGRIHPRGSVGGLGQGATGLLHTRGAKLAGARPIVAVSRSPWKRDLARRMRADRTADPTGPARGYRRRGVGRPHHRLLSASPGGGGVRRLRARSRSRAADPHCSLTSPSDSSMPTRPRPRGSGPKRPRSVDSSARGYRCPTASASPLTPIGARLRSRASPGRHERSPAPGAPRRGAWRYRSGSPLLP